MTTDSMVNTPAGLSSAARRAVLCLVFLGLVFAGFQLGIMPLAALSMSRDLLGDSYTAAVGGEWFARHTAGMMFGAAVGGIFLGALGDRIGRARAMGASILIYSLCGAAGTWAASQEQMLALRILAGLGVGGAWPNGVALAGECWARASRPTVAGVAGTGINVGIFLVSQLGRTYQVTPESWRWLMAIGGAPALLGLVFLLLAPESPEWLAGRAANASTAASRRRELFTPPLLQRTLVGIALGAIPLIGAWAASKWMIPWADEVGAAQPGYKATTQGYWAVGAILGSFFGSHLANLLGRRVTYFLISLGSVSLTCGIFLFSAPLRPEFLPLVFCQAAVTTLFFGWLPLYLPELFPTHVRASGIGIAYNFGRFASAAGVLFAGILLAWSGGNYVTVGATTGMIYALGMIVVFWAPDTGKNA
ncbi:MAG: MFS transporter [Planctomycetes bacterium]|nr:MFS transporter [Planctomycetota bacterium]